MSSSDPLYVQTRAAVLNPRLNPFFFKNKKYSGLGSMHTNYGNIWHMGLIMQAMTSSDPVEIVDCLRQLKDAAVDLQMHESFSSENPMHITRGWFAWANSLFGQMIVLLIEKYPSLMLKK